MSGENLIDATVSNCSFFMLLKIVRIISSLNVKSKVHIFLTPCLLMENYKPHKIKQKN